MARTGEAAERRRKYSSRRSQRRSTGEPALEQRRAERLLSADLTLVLFLFMGVGAIGKKVLYFSCATYIGFVSTYINGTIPETRPCRPDPAVEMEIILHAQRTVLDVQT